MNFYIVPAGLYQTQQKMGKKKHGKKRASRSSRTSSSSDKTDTPSLKSNTTFGGSIKSLPDTPEDSDPNEISQIPPESGSRMNYNKVPEFSSSTTNTIPLDMEHRHSSGSTTSLTVNTRDQDKRPGLFSVPSDFQQNRRSSIMSFSSSQSKSSNLVRKASYSQVPTASISSQLPPGTVDVRPELFSRQGSHLDHSKPHFHVPKFRPITDLSVLNKESLLRHNFLNPNYMSTRYNNFLQILSEHHLSDSMNFAAVREHSLMKFINRHIISKREREMSHAIKSKEDIRYYEGLISYELLQCRTFLRRLISLQSKEIPNRDCIISCEELLQINFINYVRYLLNLPNVLPVAPENLDDILAKHYHFRSFFSEMSSALYSLRKEGYTYEMPTSTSDVEILLETISKVSYEFILLEKYAIHILVKLNHNFAIEQRIVSHLFSLFDLNIKLERMESLKVLNYNTYFSAQYSWYMAITLPFVRVFEANIYGEDPAIVSSLDSYRAHLAATADKRQNFKDSDRLLYEKYFSRLKFKDFLQFVQLSRKDLVNLQRNTFDKFGDHSLDYGHRDFEFKPPNFEFFANSLSTLESETFHVIHSRDIALQLSPTNFKVILAEFYRLLKKGGVLEVPLFKSGDDHIQDLVNPGTSKFPNLTKFMDLEVARTFDLIPHLLESLFEELGQIFGAKNVKFSSVLLSPKNDMNSFFIKHTALSVYEIYGDVDSYCSRFATEDNSNVDKDCFHYYFYIRAEKA
ncbi:CIC11C00000002086 [Sungouiella intermedia]|uniref:CIC11C00000002086 n=1 Tax=Sungouiella intermedia TaxID=45354 RepID=A0A1L0GS28_9ASCO|nr:CIC11C00000002086 [[Candida] intermedia]